MLRNHTYKVSQHSCLSSLWWHWHWAQLGLVFWCLIGIRAVIVFYFLEELCLVSQLLGLTVDWAQYIHLMGLGLHMAGILGHQRSPISLRLCSCKSMPDPLSIYLLFFGLLHLLYIFQGSFHSSCLNLHEK